MQVFTREEIYVLRRNDRLNARGVKEENVGEERRLKVRIRYRQPLEEATLIQHDDALYILFDNPQRGIAGGQFAAWYEGDRLLGSGVIKY